MMLSGLVVDLVDRDRRVYDLGLNDLLLNEGLDDFVYVAVGQLESEDEDERGSTYW